MAPYTAARFASRQCAPCPDRPARTRGKSARTVNFLPRHSNALPHERIPIAPEVSQRSSTTSTHET
jgi:hypothetical protein